MGITQVKSLKLPLCTSNTIAKSGEHVKMALSTLDKTFELGVSVFVTLNFAITLPNTKNELCIFVLKV